MPVPGEGSSRAPARFYGARERGAVVEVAAEELHADRQIGHCSGTQRHHAAARAGRL